MEPVDIARRTVEIASDRLAARIVMLDVHHLTSFADYFVLCSGDSERQLRAIADDITARLKAEGIRVLHQEGSPASGWILLDYGPVIVHVFGPEQRQYYQLDELWNQGNAVVTIQ